MSSFKNAPRPSLEYWSECFEARMSILEGKKKRSCSYFRLSPFCVQCTHPLQTDMLLLPSRPQTHSHLPRRSSYSFASSGRKPRSAIAATKKLSQKLSDQWGQDLRVEPLLPPYQKNRATLLYCYTKSLTWLFAPLLLLFARRGYRGSWPVGRTHECSVRKWED